MTTESRLNQVNGRTSDGLERSLLSDQDPKPCLNSMTGGSRASQCRLPTS